MLRGLLAWVWEIIRSPYTLWEGWRDAWRDSTRCDVCLSEGGGGAASWVCGGCFGMACDRHAEALTGMQIPPCCDRGTAGILLRRV